VNTRFLPSVLRVLILCLAATLAARADGDAGPTDAQRDAIVSSLHWQTGTITLQDGLAKIALTPNFRFLNAADSDKVLHDLWQNPHDPSVLGMIFPADKGPAEHGNWEFVVSYSAAGYVRDTDANSINYDDLLKTMQGQTVEENKERAKEGEPQLELVGWAEPPHYDQATHKLYWAQDLKVVEENRHALNYNIRILGRRGVLDLTGLGHIEQLQQIKDETPDILTMVDFQPGNTYAEFDPKIDKVAEYGLAGLIAGGALAGAAKLGLFGAFFKWIIAAVIALKKLVIVVVVAIVAAVKKGWNAITGRNKDQRNFLPPGQQ
jgi:uncharacterized membrane-anchored protein